MRRIQAYVDATTAEALKKFADQKELSLSTAAGDILREHFERASSESTGGMDAETKSYFLRILNTLNQVLMCVYDKDRVSIKADSVEACIQSITQQIQLVTK